MPLTPEEKQELQRALEYAGHEYYFPGDVISVVLWPREELHQDLLRTYIADKLQESPELRNNIKEEGRYGYKVFVLGHRSIEIVAGAGGLDLDCAKIAIRMEEFNRPQELTNEMQKALADSVVLSPEGIVEPKAEIDSQASEPRRSDISKKRQKPSYSPLSYSENAPIMQALQDARIIVHERHPERCTLYLPASIDLKKAVTALFYYHPAQYRNNKPEEVFGELLRHINTSRARTPDASGLSSYISFQLPYSLISPINEGAEFSIPLIASKPLARQEIPKHLEEFPLYHPGPKKMSQAKEPEATLDISKLEKYGRLVREKVGTPLLLVRVDNAPYDFGRNMPDTLNKYFDREPEEIDVGKKEYLRIPLKEQQYNHMASQGIPVWNGDSLIGQRQLARAMRDFEEREPDIIVEPLIPKHLNARQRITSDQIDWVAANASVNACLIHVFNIIQKTKDVAEDETGLSRPITMARDDLKSHVGIAIKMLDQITPNMLAERQVVEEFKGKARDSEAWDLYRDHMDQYASAIQQDITARDVELKELRPEVLRKIANGPLRAINRIFTRATGTDSDEKLFSKTDSNKAAFMENYRTLLAKLGIKLDPEFHR